MDITPIANAIYYSDYALDTQERETWADEALHRIISLGDLGIASVATVSITIVALPIATFAWMAPRRLYAGGQEALEQGSFTPLAYQCAVIFAYAQATSYLFSVYLSQAALDVAGVLAPSLGAFGRNIVHTLYQNAEKELANEPSWSWRPKMDLVAESIAHAAFHRSEDPQA